MALQIKRGTNAFRLTQTLLAGEPFFVTDAQTLGLTPFWIGDGSTLGGIAAMDVNNFSELLDVNAATPINKDLLQYNSSTGSWTNSQNLNVAGTTTLTGGVTALGAVTVAGAVSVAGVLTSTGGITGGQATHTSGTFSGDVTANNFIAQGSIETNASSANIFNDYNHSAINIGNGSVGTIYLGNAGNTTTVKGALTVGGNLTVNGTTTSVNSTVVNVKDEMITLNSGETGTGVTPNTRRAGIQVDRGTLADVSIQYNEQTDKWELTNDGNNFYPIALNSGYTASTDVAVKSVSTTDYLKVSNTGASTNYISQTTAQHTAKWTLDDTPDTYKLSLDNADKITVGANSTTITGNTTITGDATVSGSLTANSLTLTGDSVLTGTLRTGNNIVLNSTVTGTPSTDATITVERGSSTDATLSWNETYDRWTASNDLYVEGNIISNGNYATNGNQIILNNDAGTLDNNGGGYYAPVGITVNRQADQYGAQSPARINWNEIEKRWEYWTPNAQGVVTVTPFGSLNVIRTAISAGTGISYDSSTGVISSSITQFTTANARSAISGGSGISYNSSTGSISINDTYGQTLARQSVSAGTGISYNSSTGVISLSSGLDPLTDVAITSVTKGQLLSYTGSQWVNTNTLSADSTANRLNLEINNSTAGVTNAMVMRKNFGSTDFANGDGTGIRFEVDSTGQDATVYAGFNATYDTTLPQFNFSTTTDNGATYNDVLNLNKDLARFYGNIKIDGNKIYDSSNSVALDFVSTTDVTGSSYNTVKFNTGSKNYGVGANFLNLDNVAEHNTKSLTTTATTTVVFDSWPMTAWRSAKYFIQISNGTDHQVWEGMALHDGTNIKITAYGDLRTNGANLATVSAAINATTGKAELRVTPTRSTTTKFKATKALIAI